MDLILSFINTSYVDKVAELASFLSAHVSPKLQHPTTIPPVILAFSLSS